MPIQREPDCACAHDGRAWVRMCPPHALEFAQRHERAQKEKDAADLLGCYYLASDQSKSE